MTPTTPRSQQFGQPSLADLMVRFLAPRSDAAFAAVGTGAEGEVVPHEVAGGFRVDPRAAWADATAAIAAARPAQPASGACPPEWAAVVNQATSLYAVPMAAGNFPQRVNDLHPLLAGAPLADLRPTAPASALPGVSGLRNWVAKQGTKADPVGMLAAVGVARSVGEYEQAEKALAAAEPMCTGDLRAAWENERAALLWQSGRFDEALAAWEAAGDTPAVRFNRGMALLFLGKPRDARVELCRAVADLPEDGGWNHLGRLYLALAEIQM